MLLINFPPTDCSDLHAWLLKLQSSGNAALPNYAV